MAISLNLEVVILFSLAFIIGIVLVVRADIKKRKKRDSRLEEINKKLSELEKNKG